MFLITNLMASNNSRNVDKGFSPWMNDKYVAAA